jgi:hypothetical protein
MTQVYRDFNQSLPAYSVTMPLIRPCLLPLISFLLNVHRISVLKYIVFKIQPTAELRCLRMKTNYTQDEKCNMLLTLDGYDNRVVNDGRQYSLRYPRQGNPEVNVLRRLQQGLRGVEGRRSRGVYGQRTIKLSSQVEQ